MSVKRRIAVMAAAVPVLMLPAVGATTAHAVPTAGPAPAVAPAYTYCNDNPGPWGLHASAVNIRSGPSTRNTILGILYRGQKWKVLSYTRGETWVRITDLTTGVTGWVSGQYVYRVYPVCLD